MGIAASTGSATPPRLVTNDASSPPAETVTTDAPRSSASAAPASVSAVRPENDSATTSVREPTKAGSALSFTTITGSGDTGSASATRTSPAMPLPPMPSTTTWSSRSAAGKPVIGVRTAASARSSWSARPKVTSHIPKVSRRASPGGDILSPRR